MFSIYTKLVLVIALGLAGYTKYFCKQKLDDNVKGITPVVVAVLSARENFDHRATIRSTWLNNQSLALLDVDLRDFKAWFIIGSRACTIPPLCRRKKFDCQKWDIEFPAVHPTFRTTQEYVPQDCLAENRKLFHQGFSFQVNHDIVVTRLGVFAKLIGPGEKLSVSLLDLQTKALVVNTTITSKNWDSSHDGFAYREVEHFLLPKNYEGLMLVEGYSQASACGNMNWNVNGGVITFTRVFISADDVESVAFSEELRAAPSVEFRVQDMAGLEKTSTFCSNDSIDWLNYNKKINEKLLIESETWGDILLLDMVDTYRNLPKKLLSFYNWLKENENFDYMLKTDDDCVVDISKILLQLRDKEQFDPKQMWIWSRFRSSWPVNYVGKWADYDYKSPVYPVFPCGGAYVLSREIVNWIQNNTRSLFSFQGEDVSLGIWLSAINPLYIEDKRWECDERCSINSFNRAQLSPMDMPHVWSVKERCGNLCQCELQ